MRRPTAALLAALLALAAAVAACGGGPSRTVPPGEARIVTLALFRDSSLAQEPRWQERVEDGLRAMQGAFAPYGIDLRWGPVRPIVRPSPTLFSLATFAALSEGRDGADLALLFVGNAIPATDMLYDGLASEAHASAVVRMTPDPDRLARTLVHEVGHLFGLPHVNRSAGATIFGTPPNYMNARTSVREQFSVRGITFAPESAQLLTLVALRDFQAEVQPAALLERRLGILHAIREAYPTDASVYDYIAHTYFELGRYDQAASAFLKELDVLRALSYPEAYARTRRFGAFIHLFRGAVYTDRPDAALAYADSALVLDSTNAELWISKGQLLVQLERPGAADTAFRAAARHAPDRQDLWVLLTQLALANRRLGAAATYLDRARSLGTVAPTFDFTLASFALQEGDTARARRRLDALPRAPRDTARVWIDVARLYHSMAQPDSARAILTRRVAADSTDAAALAALGYLYLEARRTDEAIHTLQRAAALAPATPYVWYNLGAAYLQENRFAEAQQAFERSRDPGLDDPDLRYNAALTAYLAGNDVAYERHRRVLGETAPARRSALDAFIRNLEAEQ